MATFRERLNPGLEIGGILMTNYNPRLYISRQIYEEVRKQFGDLLFESYIRQNISIVEASSVGMSIFEYEPKSKGAECYRTVTDEFLRRFGGAESSHAAVNPPEPETVPESREPEPVREPEPEIETLPEVPETEPEPEQVTEAPAPEKTPEPEAVTAPEIPAAPEPAPVREPEAKPAVPSPIVPMPGEKRVTLGAYEESIKQDVLDMLPEAEKGMWMQLLSSVTDISRGEVDVRSLREDFEDSDKDRYTFYVLNDESDSFWPVMYSDQIIEPLRCVIKWDEYGSAEVFM